MGDPKKFRKKYSTPMHPWNKTAIDEEAIIKREYGIRRKKEIYLMRSFLKKYRNIAKRLSIETTSQAEKETAQILGKLQRHGLLTSEAKLNQVSALTLKDVLERRLQSVVFRKGMARSMNQARQFITHRHVFVNGKEITAPSYLLTIEEESNLTFKENSSLASEEHPERVDPKKAIKEEAERLRKETEAIKAASVKDDSAEAIEAEVTGAKAPVKETEVKEAPAKEAEATEAKPEPVKAETAEVKTE